MRPELFDLLDHAIEAKEPLIICNLKNADWARSLSHTRVLFITSDCPETEIFYNNRRGDLRWVDLKDGSVWESMRDSAGVPLHSKRKLKGRSGLKLSFSKPSLSGDPGHASF